MAKTQQNTAAKNKDQRRDDAVDVEQDEIVTHDVQGHLTYAGMQAIHASGQSFEFRNEIYPPGRELPDEATIAEGNDEAEASVLRSLDEQEQRLQRQRERLLTNQQRRKAGKHVEGDAPPHSPDRSSATTQRANTGNMTGGGESKDSDKTRLESGQTGANTGASAAAKVLAGRSAVPPQARPGRR